MTGEITNGKPRSRNPIIIGLLLLASGLAFNFLFERNGIFKVWENSPYPVSALDGIYPPVCVFLSLTGIALVVGGAMSHAAIRRLLRQAFVIVIPLTVLYALFNIGLQFVSTGADRLGECPGLDQAASSSNVIPESVRRPGHPAVGCEVERRGIFLSYYNYIWVYGVTDAAAQQLVLDGIAEHFRQAHPHPVQLMFYDKENWSVRQLKNGATLGTGGPSKLIRVVNIG
jgi:hypothetical protein